MLRSKAIDLELAPSGSAAFITRNASDALALVHDRSAPARALPGAWPVSCLTCRPLLALSLLLGVVPWLVLECGGGARKVSQAPGLQRALEPVATGEARLAEPDDHERLDGCEEARPSARREAHELAGGRASPAGQPVRVGAPSACEESPGAFDVHGVVLDDLGHPVAAEVTAVPVARKADRAGSACRSDGSFVLRGLPAGEWKLHVFATDLHPSERHVTVGAHTPPLRFVLASPGEVHGQVLGPAGELVAGAEVGHSWASDALGRFSIRSTASSVELFAWRAGYARSPSLEVELQPGQRVDDLVLRLQPACTLHGRVLRSGPRSARRPEISIVDANGQVNSAASDEWGEFELHDLPPGETSLHFEDEDGRERELRVVLAPGRPRTVELRSPR